MADLNAMILGMPTALFPAIALEHFHGGPQTVGYLYAAPGAGALIGMLLSGWTARVVRPGRAVVAAIAVWGLAIALFGISPWLWAVLILLAVAGWADVISAVFAAPSCRSSHPTGCVADSRPSRLPSCRGAPPGQHRGRGGRRACRRAAFGGDRGLGCVAGIVAVARLMPRFAAYRLGGGAPDAGA